jgi:hypothetical protein
MTSYWLLFSAIPLLWLHDRELRKSKGSLFWISLVLITILFVGLRHRVGCDWQNYFDLYESIRLNQEFGLTSLKSILNWGPSYLALNWLAAAIGGGIYLVNLVCSTLAITGLAIFCRTLPSPWLGWAIAFPYFTTVVCMGYTRQSVAIGLFFAGLTALRKNKILRYALLILAAGTFHVTALFLLLLIIFPLIAKRDWRTLSILAGFLLLIVAVTLPNILSQISGYIGGRHVSHGAVIRGLMTALPALALLLMPKLWANADLTIWRPVGVLALMLLPAIFFASTPIDRIGLYLLPLQVFVWGTLPSLNLSKFTQQLAPLAIFIYSGLVLWVWLSFGLNARCWIPYQSILIYS